MYVNAQPQPSAAASPVIQMNWVVSPTTADMGFRETFFSPSVQQNYPFVALNGNTNQNPSQPNNGQIQCWIWNSNATTYTLTVTVRLSVLLLLLVSCRSKFLPVSVIDRWARSRSLAVRSRLSSIQVSGAPQISR